MAIVNNNDNDVAPLLIACQEEWQEGSSGKIPLVRLAHYQASSSPELFVPFLLCVTLS